MYPNAGGLQAGTQVSINGLSVGTVSNIKFKDRQGNLLVTFTVNNDFEFSKNSIAELFDTGIIGGKGIQIIPVFDEGPLAKSGDTLTSATKPGLTELVQTSLTPLKNRVEGAVSNADSLMMNFNDVLDASTKKDLRESIASLSRLMNSLQGSANVLNSILNDNKDKLDSSLTNFKVLTNNFAKLSDSLNNAGLGRTLANLESTIASLDRVMARVDNGEGTLGKLMQDEALYTNLNNASKELDLLLQDFRLNPKRYVNVSVFGKKQIEYELPEDDPAKKIEEQ